MKNLKIYILIVLSVFLTNCKNDDDSNPPSQSEQEQEEIETAYFPSHIELYNIMDETIIFYFEYNNQNQITEISSTTGGFLNIEYTNNLISHINFSGEYEYWFSYANNRVNEIVIEETTGGVTEIMVNYNAMDQVYMVPDTKNYYYNIYNSLVEIEEADSYSIIYNNENSGIFRENSNWFPLHFVTNDFLGKNLYFFSAREISQTRDFHSDPAITNTYFDYVRDENGNIENFKVNLNEGADGIDQYWITYEERAIN